MKSLIILAVAAASSVLAAEPSIAHNGERRPIAGYKLGEGKHEAPHAFVPHALVPHALADSSASRAVFVKHATKPVYVALPTPHRDVADRNGHKGHDGDDGDDDDNDNHHKDDHDDDHHDDDEEHHDGGDDEGHHDGGDDEGHHDGGDDEEHHDGGDDEGHHDGGDDEGHHDGGDDEGRHDGGDDEGRHDGGDDDDHHGGNSRKGGNKPLGGAAAPLITNDPFAAASASGFLASGTPSAKGALSSLPKASNAPNVGATHVPAGMPSTVNKVNKQASSAASTARLSGYLMAGAAACAWFLL
ncbi:hypothetical protein BGW37DRAFT_183056 [Umbelopsis sp. PMI_123]|nr:hypothetical protein BGW37DRAFT_183056 [Umbelopsis sp. PMI_123]